MNARRRDHYLREKRERELRDRFRAAVLGLAQRSAGSRDYAAASAAFARGRAELRRALAAREEALAKF